ncbi:Abcg4 protein [Thecamonas trahens ATCC 50062]|uniref:Abcg4 protein n=1 Tax=Thecamonas trahens ATCC 50062 TaxID=461836 RepID=A0A0L0D3C3_THETB|nr:Abcg4 protein [Thecamonas trahens ATCC 50062]KNC46675.1 Abcg4 protein [Thecamonas trahens ATCC 50062]|eukprot:XP_013760445.1 Abcg4 protein [Thecamonas trahens ATCC 50062]
MSNSVPESSSMPTSSSASNLTPSDSYTFVTAGPSDESDEEIVLEFNNIKVWVENFKATKADGSTEVIKRRDILRGVSGKVESGQMTMLMGASGAGKTTLFNVLAGRAHTVESSGSILVNGKHFGLAEFQEISAYVTQDATFLNSMTPDDILGFRANMLLPYSMSAEEKQARVDDVIELLGLEEVRNVRLGEPGVSARGLNFVQRKKLNIAAALLVKPRILFVDEPTTGLDAAMAKSVMLSLQRVANSRKLVVFCTIHQPSVFVYNLFDQALIMALGQIAYSGSVDNIVPHLDKLGYECDEFKNPADHVIQVLDSRDGDEKRVQKLIDAYHADASSSSSYAGPSEVVAEINDDGAPMTLPWYGRMYQLTKRALKVTLYNDKALKASVGQAIVFGILIGIIYSLDNSQAGATDRVGLLFLTTTNAIFLSLQGSVFVLIAERAVFLREVADGIYSMPAYLVSKVASDLPFQVLYQFLFSVIVYFTTGLQQSLGRFLIFVLVQSLVALVGSNLGLVLSAFTGDAATSTALAPVIIVPSMMTAGVLISTEAIPVFLRWLKHVSILRYAFTALLLNEAEDALVFHCTPELQLPNGLCPINTGNELIAQRNANQEPTGIWSRVFILVGYYVFTVVVAYLGLLFSVRNQRKTKRS